MQEKLQSQFGRPRERFEEELSVIVAGGTVTRDNSCKKMPENDRKLTLHSPAGSEHAGYRWPLTRSVSDLKLT